MVCFSPFQFLFIIWSTFWFYFPYGNYLWYTYLVFLLEHWLSTQREECHLLSPQSSPASQYLDCPTEQEQACPILAAEPNETKVAKRTFHLKMKSACGISKILSSTDRDMSLHIKGSEVYRNFVWLK